MDILNVRAIYEGGILRLVDSVNFNEGETVIIEIRPESTRSVVSNTAVSEAVAFTVLDPR